MYFCVIEITEDFFTNNKRLKIMATIKIGINGFGRIGRMVFRAACTQTDKYDVVGINDLCPVEYLAYMLKYDTMHGQFDGTIDFDAEKNLLIVNGKAIRVTAERNPEDLKWNEVEAEYVVESTGLFLTAASYLFFQRKSLNYVLHVKYHDN